jgi:protein transport protein HofC
VKKALRYPAIVLTLAVLVVLAMVTLVLPEFAAIYKTFNTPLPVLTQMVMGMAAFMQSYALALFVLLLALSRRLGSAAESSLAVHPAAYARDGRTGKRSKAGTRLYRAVTHATGGYPLLQGLESAEETVESQYWQGILRGVREDIEKGLPVWSSFQRAAIFTPLCVQLYEPVKCQVRWISCWQTLPAIIRNRPFNVQRIWRRFWSQCF